ncbi:MAG: galactokinase [Bacteroidetes bacterium]|nr:galactokinase [Bacteroidota bacterium]
MVNKIREAFESKFGNDPVLIKAPGRINLIGEHTDYNNGFVLPAAVDKAIYFAIKPNELNKHRFFAFDLDEDYHTSVDNINKSNAHWANYLLGVIAQFTADNRIVGGFDCVFGGDVPAGAGMSSSAAIECGLATAINHMNQFGYNTLQLAFMAQKAEHDYAGVQCGIMDQFASLHGRKDQVIKLDCRSLEYTCFPFKMNKVALVLVNTGVKHALAASAYNTRRNECEQGVEVIKKHFPATRSLRDATVDMVLELKAQFTEEVFKRCLYITEENDRVNKACEALLREDFTSFGELMYASHEGLRNKFEVSCAELDQLVELASGIEGVLGARMMGGGFGGCTINLVQKESLSNFKNEILAHYQTPDLQAPEIIEVAIGEGVHIITVVNE